MQDGIAVPSLTVGFVPRERFSVAAEALRRLYANTRVPFRLIVVDCHIPPTYRSQMDAVLAGRPDVEIIEAPEYLLPNHSRRLVAEVSRTEFTLFAENDMFVKEGCVDRMLQTAVESQADVVVPMLLEGSEDSHHHDAAMAMVELVETPGGTVLSLKPAASFQELDRRTEPLRVDMAESHFLLARSEFIAHSQIFDADLRGNEYVDTSLAVRKAGGVMLLEPRARATFMSPPPVEREEDAFFRFRWEPRDTIASYDYILAKWDLVGVPAFMSLEELRLFVAGRQHSFSKTQWRLYLIRTRWKWPLGRVKRFLLQGLRLAPAMGRA